MYCLLRSFVEHFCINPKSLTFDYLDEKLVDTDLMKFRSLCSSVLSWYLEFAYICLRDTVALLRVHLYSDRRLAVWVAETLWTRCRILTPFDHLLQHLCFLRAVHLGRWKDRLQLSCMASVILL
ncbi:hypothetical protein B296_00057263 [Ensete ventricosum]|uniref:Uncharacterized protein n=1 Tax=Ensete ventricosum TaxID=4639 RepID=A0A426XRX3_ENSVE|nr:hypothetical protein B296_00057263 [Ensete ventricosum]